MEEQLRQMISKSMKDKYSVYLREITLLMDENDSLKEKIKELENGKTYNRHRKSI